MRHSMVRKALALVMALSVLLSLSAVAASAKNTRAQTLSVKDQLKQDEIGTMVDDLLAHAVAWFTTESFQSLPPLVSNAVIESQLGTQLYQYYDAQSFYLTSFDGTRLYCTVFRAPKGCKRDGKNHVIINAHGFQVNALAADLYVPLLTSLGYDVVTWDQRQAGQSDHPKCTMGYNEAQDCGEIAKWVRANYGDDVVLGLYGQSMGSATIMTYSAYDPNLAFMIEDCGYADLKETMRDIQGKYLKFADFERFYENAKRYAEVNGVTYDDVKPIESVKKLAPEIPCMFIHGEGDLYINPKNVDLLYDAKQGEKVKFTVPLAGHSQSYMYDLPGYTRAVKNFMAKYNL